MSPVPTDTQLLRLVTSSHRQDVRLMIVPIGGGEHITVYPTTATLTYSAVNFPRMQLTATIPVPATQEAINATDPRRGARMHLEAGYIYPSGRLSLSDFGSLSLRHRATQRATDTFTLVATGDDQLVRQRGIDVDVARSAGGDTAAEIAGWIANRLPGAIVARQTVRVVPFIAYTARAGSDAWKIVEDLGDAAGMETFWDGFTFVIRDQPTVSGSPVVTLATGNNGIIEDSTMDADADKFANGVSLTFAWHNPAGAEQRVVGTAYIQTPDPWAWGGPAGHNLYTETRDTPVNQIQANAAAQAVLLRRLAAGRGANVTAISCLWIRPGDTVQIALPLGAAELQIVTTVSYDLVNGAMRITTRDPAAPDD